MIRLTCAQCQATLEVDDAFAGGECRCQHCGTIQTVPRPGSRPGAPGSAVGGSAGGASEPKALYQVKSRAGMSSTPSGLEELAEIVHSSGLSGSGLLERGNRPRTAAPAPAAKAADPRSALLIGAAAGAVIVLVLAIVGYVLLKNKPPLHGAAADAAITGPAFDGTALRGDKIIFVLDRGDATAGFFPALRELTVRAVASLGSDRKFQVILWDNGSPDAYPALSSGYATSAEVEKLGHWFDNVSVGRSTDVMPALKLALTQSPDTIVLATGKSVQLDDSFATEVLDARQGGHVTFDTFSLGDSPTDDPLKKIAASTGGKFTFLKSTDLNDLTQTQ
ncbi:MAG: hypothetical protein ACTHLN_02790 [Tepidisphaeraceae bacterium]